MLKICERCGFQPGAFRVRCTQVMVEFFAILFSQTHGTMNWQGTVNDRKPDGTTHWTREHLYRTGEAEHRISGTLAIPSLPRPARTDVTRATRMPTGRILGVMAKVAAVLVLIQAVSPAYDWLTCRFVPYPTPSAEQFTNQMIMTAVVVHMVCMMIPFVPGMEIGLALMGVFGASIVFLVYGAMVVALEAGFLALRLVPEAAIISGLESARLDRSTRMLAQLQALHRQDRLAWQLRHAPGRFAPVLLRFRHLARLPFFDVPGNPVLGGGGGIAMAAGFSPLFSFGGIASAVARAVSPVPLLIRLAGVIPAFPSQ